MTEEVFTKGHVITLMITSLIGVGFGAGWWFSGVAALSGPVLVLAMLGGAITVLLAAWTFRFGRHGKDLPAGGGRGDSPFGKQYGIAVLLMLVAIFAGSRLLSDVLEYPEAVPAWVLFVVGAHFAPFARIFGSTRYLLLACLLCATAVLAIGLGVAGQPWAWRLVPGFGGATILWLMVVAGLREGEKLVLQVRAQTGGAA